jgi:hypothetical protein
VSLFIQNSAGLVGTGAVSVLDAGIDLLFIANGDTNVGQTPVPGRPELEQVAYAVQAETGPPPNRLFALVNTNFGVNPQNIDIIVIAGGFGFTLNDGTLLKDFGGTSLPPGATFDGVVFNPSTSVVVLYDITQNGGQGFCCKPQNSDDLTLPTPNSVILYHELSHAFRQAQNASLDGTEPDCSDASDEESAAEVDENDMRDLLVTARGGTPDGSTRRDTNNHCGASCGGASDCCIVASIVSGSPYSAEVSALRRVRDQFLRRSSIGSDFFGRLHYDYYAFSPQVCRLMAESKETRRLIEMYFVRPLVICLNLICDRALETCTAPELGARFLSAVEKAPCLAVLSREEALEVLDLIRGRPGKALPDPRLAELIEQRGRTSEYVRWALIEPLEFFVEALLWRLEECSAEEIGTRLAHAIDRWGARLPITGVWNDLSNRAFREELRFLNTTLLRNPGARTRFAQRLPQSCWDNVDRAGILAQAGFSKEPQS